MSVSDLDVSRPRLIRDGSFLENDWREITQRRRAHNRLGFAYQVAFVRVLGRFPQQEPLEIDGEILRFAALQLGADPDVIRGYAERRQTVSEHQQQIREYLSLRPFDDPAAEDLARFLEGEAHRLDRTASLLARVRERLRDRHVLAPGESVLRRAVGSARQPTRVTSATLPGQPDPRGLSVGACHATGRASRVASIPPFHTCRRYYPGGTGRCLRRSLPDRWQPSPCSGRIGFRIASFRDLRSVHIVAARVVAEPPRAALCHRSASADVVTSIVRSDCYRLERQLPGGVRTRCGMAPFTAHRNPR